MSTKLMNKFLFDHRLLRYRINDFQSSQTAKTPLQPVNARAAQQQVQVQDATRAANLSKPTTTQQTIQTSPGGYSDPVVTAGGTFQYTQQPTFATYQSNDPKAQYYNVDPSMGGQFVLQDVTGAGPVTTQDYQKTLQSSLQTIISGGEKAQQDIAARNLVLSSAQAGKEVSYNPYTGQTSVYNPSKIFQSAFERLTKEGGMDAGQATQYLNSDVYKNAVSKALTEVGSGVVNTSASKTASATELAQRAADEAVAEAKKAGTPNHYLEQIANDAYTAALNKSNAEKQSQNVQKDAAKIQADDVFQQQNGKPGEMPQTPEQQKDTQIANINSVIDQGANSLVLAGLSPEDQGKYGEVLSQLLGAANTGIQGQLAQLFGSKALADQVYNGTMTGLDAINQRAKDTSSKVLDVLSGLKQQQEAVLRQQQEAELERQQHEQQRELRDTEKKKTKAVDTAYAELAIGGGFGSSNGLKAVHEVEYEFDQRIQDINNIARMNRTSIIVGMTAKYVDLQANYQTNVVNQMNILADKLDSNDLKKIGAEESKAEKYDSAFKSFVTNVGNIRTGYAKDLGGLVKDVGTAVNTARDDQRSQETLGWNILNTAIDNYGSLVPKSIIDRVKTMLPAGTDIQDIINTPTFAERNSKRISGAGGSGTGGLFVGGGTQSLDSSLYSNVTPQQLREAVDRVTLNFGGTGAERNRKRSEYLGRISSGESPASIMASMKTDYWTSQKGAEQTRHLERSSIQDSMDTLQVTVDYYGINGDDDGVLGRIDSRVQSFASIFGLSSEQYNNLATNVGNIRAKIIKENYGAAVTPQELKIAEGYIPEMTDKGPQFITKVRNLKAYNEYLDAKAFAREVGLPPPVPPKPTSISGETASGPSKYSVNDINSALSD